jgi:hypothetical protein
MPKCLGLDQATGHIGAMVFVLFKSYMGYLYGRLWSVEHSRPHKSFWKTGNRFNATFLMSGVTRRMPFKHTIGGRTRLLQSLWTK